MFPLHIPAIWPPLGTPRAGCADLEDSDGCFLETHIDRWSAPVDRATHQHWAVLISVKITKSRDRGFDSIATFLKLKKQQI